MKYYFTFIAMFLNCYLYSYEYTETNPFIKCNEKRQEEVLENIKQIPVKPMSLHVGWSIEFNYKVICATEPEYAIICDISSRVFEFYEIFEYTLLNSSYENFYVNLKSNISSLINHQQALQDIRAYKWITEKDFNTLKTMYAEDRISHKFLNILDEQEFDALAMWIKENNYHVHTLYLSNTLEWILQKKLDDASIYFKNLSKIMDDKTIYIHSEKFGRELHLMFVRGHF